MPILMMALIAMVAFGLIGVLLVIGVIAETRRKTKAEPHADQPTPLSSGLR
ncbi:MAG TPA: hypothetical protein VMT24_15195 [Aggregatilineaceae bacterium]|nr:hypothetical protein [Aggregatilineaceae bacterium]